MIVYLLYWNTNDVPYLQDDAIQKDRERLQRKAEINVVRNLRLRDARWRTIGIEEQELRKQVLEKERLKKEEKEISRVDSEFLTTHATQLLFN